MFGLDWKIIAGAALVILIAVVFVITVRRNRRIRQEGIETDAVVSRVEENYNAQGDGTLSVSYSYYVQYEDQNGTTHEAILSKVLQSHYRVGDELRIRYLPEKPKYAFPIKRINTNYH